MNEQQTAEALFPSTVTAKPAAKPGASVEEVLYPSMFRAKEAKAQPTPTAEERAAAAMYPTMAQQDGNAAEHVETTSAQSDVEVSAEATEFAAELAAKFDGAIDAEHPDTLGFAAVATEIGIDTDGAARLAVWDQERRAAYWNAVNAEWQAQSKQLPNFEEALDLGNDLIRRFGSGALKQDLVTYGWGNNPNLIAFLGAVGRAMKSNRRY